MSTLQCLSVSTVMETGPYRVLGNILTGPVWFMVICEHRPVRFMVIYLYEQGLYGSW